MRPGLCLCVRFMGQDTPLLDPYVYPYGVLQLFTVFSPKRQNLLETKDFIYTLLQYFHHGLKFESLLLRQEFPLYLFLNTGVSFYILQDFVSNSNSRLLADIVLPLCLPLPANFTPLRPARHSSFASGPPCLSSSALRCGRRHSG